MLVVFCYDLSNMDRNIKLLYWFNFFNDFRPYAAVAIIYFAEVTGSFALGLAVYSVAQISSAIFEVPTGLLSDIVGRKRTIVLGAFFATLSIIFFALGGSFWVLAIGGVMEGLAQSFFSGNNEALLYDTLKEKQRENEFSKWLGRTSSMFQFGLAVSAVIGGFVADWSLSYVMWISVIPQAFGLLVALLMQEPKVHTHEKSTNIFEHLKEAIKRFQANYRLRTLSVASILGFGVGETSHQFAPAFIATLWPLWAIGIARFLSHALAAGSYWFAGPLIKRFNAFRILIFAEIYSRITGIISSVFPSVVSPILLSSASIFHGATSVSSSTLFQEKFTHQQRATMGSLNSLAGSIFFGIFAYFFGGFADTYGPAAAILLANILVIPKAVLYWLAYRKE